MDGRDANRHQVSSYRQWLIDGRQRGIDDLQTTTDGMENAPPIRRLVSKRNSPSGRTKWRQVAMILRLRNGLVVEIDASGWLGAWFQKPN
jgi:hypothetical protein